MMTFYGDVQAGTHPVLWFFSDLLRFIVLSIFNVLFCGFSWLCTNTYFHYLIEIQTSHFFCSPSSLGGFVPTETPCRTTGPQRPRESTLQAPPV